MKDVKDENEMLFQSEERVKRLIQDLGEVKADLREKERDNQRLEE